MLFSDSLSVLSTLSAPLSYLIHKSLSDTQSLLNVLFESKVFHFQWIPGHSSLPGNNLADSLATFGASLDASKILMSLHHLFLHIDYPFTSVADIVSNLVSSNIKSFQCLPKSLLSIASLVVLSFVYAATGTALSLALISTGLVEPRLLHAETVVLNHRTFPILC